MNQNIVTFLNEIFVERINTPIYNCSEAYLSVFSEGNDQNISTLLFVLLILLNSDFLGHILDFCESYNNGGQFLLAFAFKEMLSLQMKFGFSTSESFNIVLQFMRGTLMPRNTRFGYRNWGIDTTGFPNYGYFLKFERKLNRLNSQIVDGTAVSLELKQSLHNLMLNYPGQIKHLFLICVINVGSSCYINDALYQEFLTSGSWNLNNSLDTVIEHIQRLYTDNTALSEVNIASLLNTYNNLNLENVSLNNIREFLTVDAEISESLNTSELDTVLHEKNVSQNDSNSLKKLALIVIIGSVVITSCVFLNVEPTTGMIPVSNSVPS